MPSRRSARNFARGRGRGRGRGHGRGDVNQQVNNEEVNQGNGDVEGAEEHSVSPRQWWCKCPGSGNDIYLVDVYGLGHF